jgi:1-acyl-sn-glycerol-3-phosphate acyltransferase
MMLRAPLRTAAVGGLSGAMLAALMLEEGIRAMSHARRDVYVRTWARSLLRLLDVDARVEAAVGALEPSDRPRLVVANHRSTLDIPLVLHLFGGHLLARGDMADWPGIGVLARRAGTLFVDRSNPTSGAAAVQRIRERLRRGIVVSVFPEGTTFADDEVREFHAGAFVAVARERGDILPVGIAYEHPDAIYGDEPVMDHMKRLVRAASTRVGVAIGAPIPASRSTLAGLASTLRGEVQTLVHRARSLAGGATSV